MSSGWHSVDGVKINTVRLVTRACGRRLLGFLESASANVKFAGTYRLQAGNRLYGNAVEMRRTGCRGGAIDTSGAVFTARTEPAENVLFRPNRKTRFTTRNGDVCNAAHSRYAPSSLKSPRSQRDLATWRSVVASWSRSAPDFEVRRQSVRASVGQDSIVNGIRREAALDRQQKRF
jgi:hypothetical protein